MKEVNGLWYPDRDTELHRGERVQDIEVIMPFVKKRRAVVQAGGAVGRWAMALSKLFDVVYTFEPEPENFACLNRNLGADYPNVIRMQAAVGYTRKPISMNTSFYPNNAGAQFVDGDGIIPSIRIDDLGLDNVDLIQLDIEGGEHDALWGAFNTLIKSNSPPIVLELKELSHDKDAHYRARKLIEGWGYKQVGAVARDVIFTRE